MNLIGIPLRAATRALSSSPRHPRKPRPERASKPSPAAEIGSVLRAFRAAALWLLAMLIATADGAAFSESYRGLFDWAEHHSLSGFWAAAFPLQVDLFILVGELVLFVAMLERWGWKDRVGAWAVAALGLAVSVAGNIGHVTAHDLQSRGTAAVPPVAAFGALWLGLGVLKRVLRARQQTAAETVQVAQAGAERDKVAEVLAGLTEAVMLLARQAAEPLPAVPDHSALLAELTATVRMLAERPADVIPAPVPADAESAALAAMKATVAAGNPLSGRQLEIRFGLTRAQATKVREVAGAAPEPSPNGASAGA